jgi:hypothetical protein
MVMTKTFWVSAVLAMLLVMVSYSAHYDFRPVSEISSAALEMTGMNVNLSDTGYFAASMITQYLILLTVFYFILRSVAKSFKS